MIVAVAVFDPYRTSGTVLGRRRDIVAVAVSLASHALVVLGIAVLASLAERATGAGEAGQSHNPAAPTPSAEPAAAPVGITAERRRALQAAVAAGRMRLGDAWLELEDDRNGAGPQTRQASDEYRRLLSRIAGRLRRAEQPLHQAIVAELRAAGLHYQRRLNRSLTEALLGGGGDCVGRTRLISSLIHDLGFESRAKVRVFSNHLAPVLLTQGKEHRFGMVAACTGLGVRIGAVELMDADLPESADACHDENVLFGSPLTDSDPPPSWSGREPPVDMDCPLAEWPWREGGQPVAVPSTRQVSAAWDGWPVLMLEPTNESLMAYSAGLACHMRVLEELRRRRAAPRKLLPALAKAIGYRREAALAFAAAGDLKTTRVLEARQSKALAEAKRLQVSTNWRGVAVGHDFWSLVYLGASAQQHLLELAAQDTSWFSSCAIAVLIREPASRADALELLRTRVRPQQFEIADQMDWTEDTFLTGLELHPSGEHVLRLRAALRATRRASGTCRLEELAQTARREVERSQLPPPFAPALVAFLAENPVVYLHDHDCSRAQFARALAEWEASQPAEIREWLGRSRP
jgi:hypothetical protein